MALTFGAHASQWKKWARLIDGVPAEFRELAIEEDACFGPDPLILAPLPTPEDLAQGRKPAGSFMLAVDSPGPDPMTAFACLVLAVASRETMPALCQASADWTFDAAALFSPDDFCHPRLSITAWEQRKAVRRMEGNDGENACTTSKWVQPKKGMPTEEIGVPAAAPSDPTTDMNDADSGPFDPALWPQCKNLPRPGNPHDLPVRLGSNGVSDATSSAPSGSQQQGAAPSDAAHFIDPTVKGPHQGPPDDSSPSSALPVGRSGDNPNCKCQLAKTISWPTQDPQPRVSALLPVQTQQVCGLLPCLLYTSPSPRD